MNRVEAIITLTNTASLLRDGTRYMKPEHEKQFREAYEMAIKALEQPEQRWIPVGERLPEVHESGNSFSGIYMQSVPVLVYGICEGEKNAQFHVVTYCDDLDGTTYWSTELDAFTITKVTAWMPLPEPYKPPTRSQYRRMQEQKGEQE